MAQRLGLRRMFAFFESRSQQSLIEYDLEHAFGSLGHGVMWPILVWRVGVRAAVAITQCVAGHLLTPLWIGCEGAPVRIPNRSPPACNPPRSP